MLPEGFPLFPASVPDVSVPALLLLVGAMLVVMVAAIFLADVWAHREETAERISELPPRAKKAA